jgi:hypothetical protein
MSAGNQSLTRRIPLEPVDALTITTLVDNVYDVWMPDEGQAKRSGVGSTKARLPAATMPYIWMIAATGRILHVR